VGIVVTANRANLIKFILPRIFSFLRHLVLVVVVYFLSCLLAPFISKEIVEVCKVLLRNVKSKPLSLARLSGLLI